MKGNSRQSNSKSIFRKSSFRKSSFRKSSFRKGSFRRAIQERRLQNTQFQKWQLQEMQRQQCFSIGRERRSSGGCKLIDNVSKRLDPLNHHTSLPFHHPTPNTPFDCPLGPLTYSATCVIRYSCPISPSLLFSPTVLWPV